MRNNSFAMNVVHVLVLDYYLGLLTEVQLNESIGSHMHFWFDMTLKRCWSQNFYKMQKIKISEENLKFVTGFKI